MADLSDVENAMVFEVTAALYPQGVAQASAVGSTCRVYRGWPSTGGLNSDLAAGIVNVTVFPAIRPDELPGPYLDMSYTSTSSVALIATVTGQSVSFSGSVVGNQTVGLLVDRRPFSLKTNAGDTLENIAANLVLLIGAERIVTVSGATLTIPGAGTLMARVVTNATVLQGLRRQRKEIQVNCWCPTVVLRDAVCKIVDNALANSPFIELADDTKAHVLYTSTQVYDQSQNALLYRRDLYYRCEYTVISSAVATVMLFGKIFHNETESFV